MNRLTRSGLPLSWDGRNKQAGPIMGPAFGRRAMCAWVKKHGGKELA
jgi:hypothetical protein